MDDNICRMIEKKESKKMMSSDCCGVDIVDDIAGLELCPRCWEHCDVIIDDSDSEEK